LRAKKVQRLRPEAFVHPSGTTRINVRERAPSNIFEGIQIMPVDRYFSGSEMNPWFFLSVAIVSEVIATSALKSSNGFTQLWPSLIVITGYGAAFFFLSLALHTIPVGIAYAVWSGGGIVLITLMAWLVLGQSLDAPAILGLALIVAGVIVLNVFSKAAVE
jgi:small multidrug resistance pump